jgi:hypothetical protein
MGEGTLTKQPSYLPVLPARLGAGTSPVELRSAAYLGNVVGDSKP